MHNFVIAAPQSRQTGRLSAAPPHAVRITTRGQHEAGADPDTGPHDFVVLRQQLSLLSFPKIKSAHGGGVCPFIVLGKYRSLTSNREEHDLIRGRQGEHLPADDEELRFRRRANKRGAHV
jgi:hypothetical protein